jgi:DNA gyrase/topoisomerase IV subunit A
LTEALRLQAEIDRTARGLEKSYEGTLRRINMLKNKLKALEQTVSSDRRSEGVNHAEALDSVAESLNTLSDTLIVNSKKAWQTYTRLESKCKASGSESARLDNVRVLCKKTEAAAADLLCYTLGRLRHAAKGPE